jgi:large subunit ribosomal protein L30
MAKNVDKQIKITQTKSSIGYHVTQKRTLEALGLRKMSQSVVKTNTPQIQGMVKKIQHLVLVEDI